MATQYAFGQIVTSGLVLALNAADKNSYIGSGTTLIDLTGSGRTGTLGGTHSLTTTAGVSNCIRLTNTSVTAASNVSRINCSSVPNITTVSIWYYQHSTPATRYLLDMRTGGANGYIYDGGFGPDWATGTLYKNGVSLAVSWANLETTGVWQNITVIANTPATDDINLFSRFSDNEGMDVSFATVLIYNRSLSATEITQNYNAQKSRFGL